MHVNVSDRPTHGIITTLNKCGLTVEITIVMTFEFHEDLCRRFLRSMTSTSRDSQHEVVSVNARLKQSRSVGSTLSRICPQDIRPKHITLSLSVAMDQLLQSYDFTATAVSALRSRVPLRAKSKDLQRKNSRQRQLVKVLNDHKTISEATDQLVTLRPRTKRR